MPDAADAAPRREIGLAELFARDDPRPPDASAPCARLIYEDTDQTVDLQVSPDTLLAILRHVLAAERPEAVDVTVHVRSRPPAGR